MLPVDHLTATPCRPPAVPHGTPAAWQEVVEQIAALIGVDDPQPALLDAIHHAMQPLSQRDGALPDERHGSIEGRAPQRRQMDTVGSGPAAPRHPFSWSSTAAQHLLRQVERVAAVDSTALLVGESGTGKSMLARMIHQRSQRSAGPFVAVNCASLPRELMDAELFGHTRGAFTGALDDRPGKVEAADGGTLFLDEIADLPIELQPKLLTFLQDKSFYRIGSNQLRQVDVRVISATHSDPALLTADHKFRQDLFFRLAVLRIDVPPLRHRIQDIRPLAQHMLDRLTRQYGIPARSLSDEALKLLESYHWPGNFRELENTLESAVAFCATSLITADDLRLPFQALKPAEDMNEAPEPTGTLAELERRAIIQALRANNGNKARTARDLGISLRSIYNKMQRHGIVMHRHFVE